MHHQESHPATKNLYLEGGTEGAFLSIKQGHRQILRTCREYESVEVLAVDK